jgi:hypothetical protein
MKVIAHRNTGGANKFSAATKAQVAKEPRMMPTGGRQRKVQ